MRSGLATLAARVLAILALLAGTDATVQGSPGCGRWDGGDNELSQRLSGVSWDAWRILLGLEWSEAARAQPGWLDADAMIGNAGAAPVPAGMDYKGMDPKAAQPFEPASRPTAEQRDAYGKAAGLFRAQDLDGAVAAFDEIVASGSPYAPAAAYSAARAVLDAGDVRSGIERIARIVADPAMADMHQAAHHLVGTLAHDTGEPRLLAARLAEIEHLLMAPADLRCRRADLRALVQEAEDDLNSILLGTFPTKGMGWLEPWAKVKRDVFAGIAAVDPFVETLRALAAPSPFKRNDIGMRGRFWIEPFQPVLMPYPSYGSDAQKTIAASDEDAELTEQVRSRAVEDAGNPLWAYALAQRTTQISDIPTIVAARAVLPATGLADGDREALSNWLAAQHARILLMAGQQDEALAVVRTMGKVPALAWRENGPHGFIAEGGTRLLLARMDLDAARRWAAALRDLWGQDLTKEFAILLARTWEEAVRAPAPDDADVLPAADLASGLDLLPADRLVALANMPGVQEPVRRAMLSAAWVRYFILDRDQEFRALFPVMRRIIPEAAADIDAVERTVLPSRQRHLVTRMMLRLPGLSPRVLWARRGDPFGRPQWVGQSVLAINPFDPSDGNWWCAMDPARAQRDFFAQAFAAKLSRFFWRSSEHDPRSLLSGTSLDGYPDAANALARTWIGAHPLSKDHDVTELERMARRGSGPARLAGEAVAWARESSTLTRALGLDDGLAETLALAVRATRYGCRRNGPLGPVSRAAWQALHQTYPGSDWAARTPYWFDIMPARR